MFRPSHAVHDPSVTPEELYRGPAKSVFGSLPKINLAAPLWPASRRSAPLPEVFFQGDGVIVFGILRAIDERDNPVTCLLEHPLFERLEARYDRRVCGSRRSWMVNRKLV